MNVSTTSTPGVGPPRDPPQHAALALLVGAEVRGRRAHCLRALPQLRNMATPSSNNIHCMCFVCKLKTFSFDKVDDSCVSPWLQEFTP